MIRKIIPVFTAAAISMSITFVVPVAITAVSSFTFVSEAQAWGGLKKIKRVAKKAKRVVKRKYNKTKRKVINTKNIVTGKRCKGGSWINTHGLCGFSVDPLNGAHRTVKRKLKKVTNLIPNGRIGDPVRGTNIHDHRRKPPSGVAITFNPLRWR